MNTPILYCAPGMSPELKDAFLEYAQLTHISRLDFLLKAGEVSRNIHFVESGLLRCFYRKGPHEISSWFAQEGGFCWSAGSFLRQEKGIEYIQALEDTLLCSLSYAHIRCICRDYPHFQTLKETVKEKHLLAHEQRMQAMWMQRSGRRLDWFVERFPGLEKKLSGKHIASYLGVSEVMLSRLRHMD